MAEQPIIDSRDGGNRAGIPMGSTPGSSSNRFASDLKPLQELDAALTKLNTNVNKLKTDLPRVITLTEQWAAKMQRVANAMKDMGISGAGGAGGSPNGAPAGTLTQQVLGGGGGGLGGLFNTYQISVDRSQTANVYGGGGGGRGIGGGGGGGGGGAAGLANALTSALAPLMNALNNRINTSAEYSLSANRMDMLYQQMTGMSGQGVRDAFRAPLQQYKLGAGGINSVLALQASTGINANMQAKSVEALRAASGYGYSTDQINQMTRGMASAESANRMFMMMGTGIYGVGGKQRSTMDVVKDTVRRLNLTSESALQGAMAPGSMTREKMRQNGVPEDMQDLVLQYARENVAFKKKGGAGMYDPSNKANRRFMGVEGAYANQYEETARTKASREESMYNKQADNFAAMERQMQSLTKTMQKLEDSMAGLIGLKIRNRGFGSIAKGALPLVGTALGAMLGGPAGALIGGAAGNLAGAVIGDPTGEKGGPNANTGDKGNIARSQGQLQKLHPKMRERIQKMMEDNPRLYIGGGVRSTQQQKELFLSRYQPTSEKTDVFWKNQYWKRVRGAAAAPPGMSMHEIGLAVDLAPATEFDWIKKNANKYGLRSFFDVNNEPWHVQPAELPASRMKYEQGGAPWGHNGNISEPTDTKASISGLSAMEHQAISSLAGAGGKGVNIAIQNYAGLSMGEAINAMGLEMGSGGGGGGSESSGSTSVSASAKVGATPGSNSSGVRRLKGVEVARYLYNAGFRGANLSKAVAIAYRESRFNAGSLTNDSDDYSFGLMQINMKGAMGPDRLKKFKLNKNEDLLDPATNARVAYELFSGKTSGAGNLPAGGWTSWDSKKYPLTHKGMLQAKAIVKEAGYDGDPVSGMGMAPSNARGAGSLTIQGDSGNSYNVTIAPVIHLNGGNNYNADVQRMARDVAKLLDREVRLTLLRTS